MKKISCALAILASLFFSTTANAQVDIAISGVTPLSNERLKMGTSPEVTVGIRNLGQTVSQAVMVKVIIRTYTAIVVYADSVMLPGVAPHSSDTIVMKPFKITETGFYSVSASATTTEDNNELNNIFSNPRVDYQADVGPTSIVTPTLDEVKLQKLTFPIKGKFRSHSLMLEEDVRARVLIRRCHDNAIVYQADSYIPELPQDTVTVQFQFPSQQGIYDVRKLDPGCYKMQMFTRLTSDFNFKNDTVSIVFNVNENILANDVMIDSVNALKNKTLKPGESLSLSFMYGNVGKLTQASVPVHVVITDQSGNEVYHGQSTLITWGPGESRSIAYDRFLPTKPGIYTLRSYTALSSDEFRFNDTLTRFITVDNSFTFKMDTVLVPTPGQRLEVGIPFTPKARVSWSGNAIPTGKIEATLELRSKKGNKGLAFRQALTGFNSESGDQDISFVTPLNGYTFSELTKGDYTATATIWIDGNPVSTSQPIVFQLAYPHDVRFDSMISPIANATYPSSEVELGFFVGNIGLMYEEEVQERIVIIDRDKDTVYRRSITAGMDANAQYILQGPKFKPENKGMFEFQLRLSLPIENDTTDNNSATRFHVGYPYDATLDSAINPRPKDRKPFDQNFSPSVYLDWLGIDTARTEVTLDLRMLKCDNNLEVYHQTRNISPSSGPPQGVVTFSNTAINGTEIKYFPIGCYNAVFTATHPLDPDRSDDTLIVPFTIEDNLGVDQASSQSLAIESVMMVRDQLNVRLRTDLNDPVSYTVIDLLGNRILAGTLAVSQSELRLHAPGLSSGTYMLEITQGRSSARRSFSFVK